MKYRYVVPFDELKLFVCLLEGMCQLFLYMELCNMFYILSVLLFLYSSVYEFAPRTVTYMGVIRYDGDCC